MSESSTGVGTAREPGPESATAFDAIVIGAGFAGIYMLHELRKLGLSARLLEAGDDVGGTWYWNRYPGARCDSDSLYYSFSFDDDLDQDYEWPERFAVQPEVMKYLSHVTDRHDLRRDMQFNTYVTSLTFDDATSRWTVGTRAGEEFTAKYCITAMGCLSLAYTPDFKGLDTFEGIWHHTGHWPHEGVDFTGKRVAVVGTGASGVQVIPIVAEAASQLVVFQRTPNYAIPARNHPWDPDFMAEYKREYPEMRAKGRTTANGRPNNPAPRDLAADSPEVRRQVLEAAWDHGGIEFIYSYTRGADLMTVLADFIRSKIDELVDDPDVAALLKPTTHPLGAKRPPLETNYYVTYNRDNVKLIDVNATPIEEITPTGIRTSDAQYDVDIIVLATGFDAVTGPLLDLDVRGPRRAHPRRQVDGRSAHVPRHRYRRLPQPVHAHRPGESEHPQRGGPRRDRAARRVRDRVHRPPRGQCHRTHRSHGRGRGPVERARRRGRPDENAPPDQLVVRRREHPRQAPGAPRLRRRDQHVSRPLRRGGCERLRGLHAHAQCDGGTHRLVTPGSP